MILDRQRLVNIFNILGIAVGNKVMQVADYVQFRVDRQNQRLFISTTDFNTFLTIDYGEVVQEEMAGMPEVFLLKFKQLQAILKASTTEDVTFTEPRKDGPIRVQTNGTYDLARYAQAEDFPPGVFEYTELGRWEVPVIQSAWDKAVVAISKDVTKISYQGVNYDGNFAASDARRLSVASTDAQYTGEPLLLHPSFGDVLKNCKNTVSVGPNKTRKMIVVICEEIGLLACMRMLDARFVDYKKLLASKSDGIRFTVAKQEILGAIQRLMIFTDQIYKTVILKIIRDTDLAGDISFMLELSVENKSCGTELIDLIDHNIVNDPTADPVIANNGYHIDNLLDGLSVTDDQNQNTLSMQDDGKLWIDEKAFNYLLAPSIDQKPK